MEGEGLSLGDRDSSLVCELNGRLKGIHEDRKWRTIDVFTCENDNLLCFILIFLCRKGNPPFGVVNLLG